jgi:DNA-binding XRE family transcriptional regulator
MMSELPRYGSAMAVPSLDTMRRNVPRTLVRLPHLADRRIRRGWTQRELADKAGTSRVNVGRIETGGDTTPGMARKLADALECAIDDLLAQS